MKKLYLTIAAALALASEACQSPPQKLEPIVSHHEAAYDAIGPRRRNYVHGSSLIEYAEVAKDGTLTARLRGHQEPIKVDNIGAGEHTVDIELVTRGIEGLVIDGRLKYTLVHGSFSKEHESKRYKH